VRASQLLEWGIEWKRVLAGGAVAALMWLWNEGDTWECHQACVGVCVEVGFRVCSGLAMLVG
jgi:hypothetical protein